MSRNPARTNLSLILPGRTQAEEDLLYAYWDWLHMEARFLAFELFPNEPDIDRYFPVNRVKFQPHRDNDARRRSPASARAALVLDIVGAVPSPFSDSPTTPARKSIALN